SLAFERATAQRFFKMLRRRCDAAAVIEPRHATWFDDAVEPLLIEHRIGRVAADPAVVAAAAEPGGDPGVVYFRLHGSPRIYYSSYDDAFLARIAERLEQARSAGTQAWCIFDNTAHGAAIPNALRTASLTTTR
ncbi:MAG TPA: DUF72 domain-containing protein, partial [Rudaea sp.]